MPENSGESDHDEVPEPRLGGRLARLPMTVEEAQRIEKQAASGAIDPSMPGVQKLIDEAHRTTVQAYLWGTTDGRPEQRRLRWLFITVCGAVVLTIAGLVLSFLLASR